MIPQVILQQLQLIEPNATFQGSMPKVTSSSGKRYFVKIGSSFEHEQYTGEAESLSAMHKLAPGLVPEMLQIGRSEADGEPFFISEYKDMGHLSGSKAADVLAKRLANELHKPASDHCRYGFEVPTFCGATKMRNGWFDTWEKCYDDKIRELLDYLRPRGSYNNLCKRGDQVRERVIPRLLGQLKIRPALLHGDLWSGNVGIDAESGQPIIFDPSSYYGHNEADLAIARIFGGFPESFFSTYFEHYPKAEPVDDFEARCDLYELFHYLNHTVLFGGGYARSAERKMDALLDFVG